MINQRLDGLYFTCDKCGNFVKRTSIFSEKLIKKYSKKKTFCGRCIQGRIHRNDPDWDYDKEFAFSLPKYTKEEKKEFYNKLEVLRLFCM